MKRIITSEYLTKMVHHRICHSILSLKPIAKEGELAYLSEPIYVSGEIVKYEFCSEKEPYQTRISGQYFSKKHARLIIEIGKYTILKAKDIATFNNACILGIYPFKDEKDLKNQTTELIMTMFGIDTWHDNENLCLTNIKYIQNFSYPI